MSFNRKPPPGNVRFVQSGPKRVRELIVNKANRTVQCESFDEFRLVLGFERRQDVRDYCSQPEIMEFLDEKGKKHTYVPDFLAWLYSGAIEIHEVTRAKRRSRPDIKRREAAGERICIGRGQVYTVHTEANLPAGTELANLMALWGFRPRVYRDEDVTYLALQLLGGADGVPFARLVQTIASQLARPRSSVTPCLCHLAWHHIIDFDLNVLLLIDGAPSSHAKLWCAQR